MTVHSVIAITTALLLAPLAAVAQDDQAADAKKIQEIRAQHDRGESLSADEQAFVQKMLAKRRNMQQGAESGPPESASPADWRGLIPLTDLGTDKYKGEDGGLYGGGRNEPPAAHRAAYLKESEKIRPRDADGKPSDDGKIGLITIGFSNTSIESAAFKRAADADPQKSPRVVIVNGAIGGRSAVMWAWDGAAVLPRAEQERLDKEMDVAQVPKTNRRSPMVLDKDTWPILAKSIAAAGLSPQQVQACWLKHVEANPKPLGEFPNHARALQADITAILNIARHYYPNLRVVYLSSRTFGGWSGRASGSPEPYAYESGFGTRWVVQGQIRGDAQLNYDPARGAVKAPVVLWGPYLWAQGNSPRKLDGLVWSENDVRADRLHPNETGAKKTTALLLNFFKTDEGARRWFLATDADPVIPAKVDSAAFPPTKPNSPGSVPAKSATDDFQLDPQRVRRLMEKSTGGEQLSPEDREYLDRARQAIRQRRQQ
jgi:hypothetical protein